MQAVLRATSAPYVQFQTFGFSATSVGALEFYVISPTNGSVIPVFTLGVNSAFNLTVRFP